MTIANKLIDAIDIGINMLGIADKSKYGNHVKFLENERKDLINSVKFSIDAELPEMVSGKMPVYARPPFALCFYEVDTRSFGGGYCGILLREQEEGYIKATLFQDTQTGMIESQYVEAYIVNSESGVFVKVDSTHDFIASDFLELEHLSKCACSIALQINAVLACSNVELVDNNPSRLKQSRVKKGKHPLFEYKTLHIKTTQTKNINSGGGSHSSPRVHLRRGHIRKLGDGKTTWVQSCVVGDKSKGIIHKDYQVH